METIHKDENIADVMDMIKLAEKNKVNEDYDEATNLYKNAAELLISLMKSLDKSDPKKKEYKELAGDILSRGEATK